MVNVGDKAPDFKLKNQDQKEIGLADYKGKQVLLAFFPFAFSPVCADEMTCFRNDLMKFKGTEIVGISVDSHWTQKAFADKMGVTHPLLSDFDKEVAKKYEVLRKEGFSERAYFVIDEKGVVKFKHVMETPGKRLDDSVILEALK